MNDLYYSIPTIIFCAIGYYFSWKYYSKHNFTVAVILLMICGLALRVYTSCDFFLHPWDERYHALVAKNLINHPLTPTLYDNPILPYDYKNWTGNHIWVHKQPLPLWTMAASMWLFGVNEIALRLPSIILTTIGIWLAFFIGSYFCNKKVGYLTAFLFSINGLIIELTAGRVATDHIDIFFLFFIELAIVFSILFAQRKKMVFNLLAGVSIGAAILSKWLPALIVLPIWLLVVLDSEKFKPKEIIFNFIILLTTCCLIFLPWQLYIFKAFPVEASWEAGFNLKHITEVLDGRTGPFYYFIDRIRINYGELIYLPLIWYLWKYAKNIKDLKRLAIVIWVLVPLVFFSIPKTKMQAYILFISPALFLATAEFFFMLNDYKKNRKLKWFFNLILILLIALPVRYSIERVKPFEQSKRNPVWAVDLRKLNKKNISKGVLLNYNKPIEAMFYTNLTAYPYIPDKNKITDMIEKGYTVIINDDGKIPDDIKSVNGIKIERLSSE
ncbi:MAG: glycosyltransferase family 39 protein [Bacteroidales bacterium]